jgi:hypothetical protein
MMPTETPDMQAIVERLAKVEKQNRRLRGAGLLVVGLACSIVLMGQSAPTSRTLEAQAFILTDAQGRTRASLRTLTDGPHLALFDANGKLRVDLGVSVDGPVLQLLDQNGNFRVALRVTRYERLPGNVTRVEKDVPGWAIPEKDLMQGDPSSGEEEAGVSLVFYDGHGGDAARLTESGGIATLGLASRHAEGVILLSAHRGGPSVRLYDKNGFRSFLGSTELVTPETGEEHKRSAASVLLFDGKGHTLWSAP